MSSLAQFINVAKEGPTPASIVWKGETYNFLIKTLNAGEIESVSEKAFGVGANKKKAEGGNFRSRMIAAAVLDEDGSRKFSVDIVKAWPNKLSNLVYAEVAKVNDLGQDDEDDAGEASPETTDSD
jgi:hypothetical protein